MCPRTVATSGPGRWFPCCVGGWIGHTAKWSSASLNWWLVTVASTVSCVGSVAPRRPVVPVVDGRGPYSRTVDDAFHTIIRFDRKHVDTVVRRTGGFAPWSIGHAGVSGYVGRGRSLRGVGDGWRRRDRAPARVAPKFRVSRTRRINVTQGNPYGYRAPNKVMGPNFERRAKYTSAIPFGFRRIGN